MDLQSHLESFSHDGERYAEILRLEKVLGDLKKSLRHNVEKNWADYRALKVTTRKVWKVDPDSRYGKDIQNLKTAIKELEAQSKSVGAGKFEDNLAIGLATGKKESKTDKIIAPTKDSGQTNEGSYASYFFDGTLD